MHDMYDQPRYGPDAASPLFADGTADAAAAAGHRAACDAATLAATSAAAARGTRRAARSATAAEARRRCPTGRPRALLLRGQERYTIYCMPCHSPVGDGDGLVVRRGFPRAAQSITSERLRDAPRPPHLRRDHATATA